MSLRAAPPSDGAFLSVKSMVCRFTLLLTIRHSVLLFKIGIDSEIISFITHYISLLFNFLSHFLISFNGSFTAAAAAAAAAWGSHVQDVIYISTISPNFMPPIEECLKK